MRMALRVFCSAARARLAAALRSTTRHRRKALLAASWAVTLVSIRAATVIPIAPLERSTPVDFATEILPILRNNCLACHNQTRAKADLVLETPETILKGSENGAVVIPGRSEASLLLQVASHQGRPAMPPRDNTVAATDLTPRELGLLKLWIDQGVRGGVQRAMAIHWQPLPERYQPVYAVALTPDGQIAACNRANRIYLYDLPAARLLTCLADPHLPRPEANAARIAHYDAVHALAFAPGGDLLASAGYREVKLWRRHRPVPTFEVAALTNPPAAVALSPDGQWIAIGEPGGGVCLRQLPAGRELRRLNTGPEPVRSLQFSPGAAWLLSARDQVVQLWDVVNGGRVAEIKAGSEVTALAWLDGDRHFAFGTAEGRVGIGAVPCETQREPTAVRVLEPGHGSLSMAGMPGCAEQLLTGSADGQVRLWEITSGKLLWETGPGAPVIGVAVAPDARAVASAGLDRTVALWTESDGNAFARLKGERGALERVVQKERAWRLATNEVAFRKAAGQAAENERKAQTGRVRKAAEALASAEKSVDEKRKKVEETASARAKAEKAVADLKTELDKATEKWRAAETAAEEAKPPGLKQAEERLASARKQAQDAEEDLKKATQTQSNAENELALAITAAQRAAETATEALHAVPIAEADLKRIESELESARRLAAESENQTPAVAFSPDGLVLASGGEDGLVHLWSAKTGETLETLGSHQAPIASLAFRNSHEVVAITSDGTVARWDLSPDWTLEPVLGTGDANSPIVDRVNALAFSPDGQTLAVGSGEPSRSGQIQLWNVASGKLKQEFNQVHSDTVFGLDFSRNGRYLASGAADRFLRVLDLDAGKVAHSFEGHTHHVLGVAWKQDGRTLATAGADNVIKMWDFASGERRKNIDGFEKEVTSISCFAGDAFLASSGDHQVRVVNDKGDTVRVFDGARGFLNSAAASLDGRRIVAGGDDSVLYLWNGNSGKLLAAFPPPQAH